jgi:hypothetical protein
MRPARKARGGRIGDPTLQRRAPAVRLRRDVALSRSRLESTLIDPHVDLMGLAVAARRGESKQVLRVQLIGDAGEGRTEILPIPDFDVASAGLFRDPCQPGIGQIRQQHRLKTAGTEPRVAGRALRLCSPIA